MDQALGLRRPGSIQAGLHFASLNLSVQRYLLSSDYQDQGFSPTKMPFSGGTVSPSKPGAKTPSFDSSSESSSTESRPNTDHHARDNVTVDENSSDGGHFEDYVSVEDSAFAEDPKFDLSVQRKQDFVIRLPPLVSPISSYLDSESYKEVSDEEDVLRKLIVRLSKIYAKSKANNSKCDAVRNNACFGEETFTSLKLEDFVIYRPSSAVGHGLDAEFAALQDLCVRRSNTNYLFDGFLSLGHEGGNSARYYVEKVSFENLSIGGYGDMNVFSVENTVWISSQLGLKDQVWYQLCSPAKEYQRFHEPFIWIATFTKAFLAFMDDADSGVTLRMLKSQFWDWVCKLDEDNAGIREWANKYSDTDYRRVVTTYYAFLKNEARQINAKYMEHPIWSEVDPQALAAIPTQPTTSGTTNTVVTPLVYESFSRMPWQRFMTPHADKDLLHGQSVTFVHAGGLQPIDMPNRVHPGEVVKIERDRSGPWKTYDKVWLAFVQEVVTYRGKNALRILWLYRPTDTICANMKYHYQNELFLSDHCACDQPPIPEESILGKAKVALWGSPTSDAEYFIRQIYSNEAFESLKGEHFYCKCTKPFHFEGETGQTVLIKAKSRTDPSQKTIEVVELTSIPSSDKLIQGRHLVRRRDCKDNMINGRLCAPNELVYTRTAMSIPIAAIIRPCHVRFFTPDDEQHARIPAPFSRGGTGDAFFITHREVTPGGQELQPYPFKASMSQSSVPSPAYLKRLRALDLFCGGGNFGRGIEEGGVATVNWAVDHSAVAMHTYRANMEHPGQTHLFLGSVNDYLQLALNGADNHMIAKKGEVDMILAGSPCQGFSLANKNSSNDQGLQYQSMIASVASFIDFYRPKYALFENVKNMSANNAGQNAFSQMICTLVSMGYQVHQFCIDAWSVGSCQSRTRLFIAATAPGYIPLKSPPVTHSHPARVLSSSLGTTANGERFGTRDIDADPVFPHVTIGEATGDIDYNFDGRTASIRFPDHRVVVSVANTDNRLRMSHIPRNHPKAGLGMAFRAGLTPMPLMTSITPKLQEKLKQKACASFQRNYGPSLIPTVTTSCTPMDQFTGKVLHWECDRTMTVLEVRRAQGFPDQEVIIGTPAQQWKVIGNSVARPVALALGMALREAWMQHNFPEGTFSLQSAAPVDYDQPEPKAMNHWHLVKIADVTGSTSDDSNIGFDQPGQAVTAVDNASGETLKNSMGKRARPAQSAGEGNSSEDEPLYSAKKQHVKKGSKQAEESPTARMARGLASCLLDGE